MLVELVEQWQLELTIQRVREHPLVVRHDVMQTSGRQQRFRRRGLLRLARIVVIRLGAMVERQTGRERRPLAPRHARALLSRAVLERRCE